MNTSKHLRALAALFALTGIVACGEPAAPDAPQGAADELGERSAEAAPAPQADRASPADAPSTAGAGRETPDAGAETAFDPRNARFTIDGRQVVLTDGLSQTAAAPGSASLVTTRYLGKDAHGDLDGDGRDDVAYFVTRDGAGSGRFTYVVAALNRATGYRTTNAFPVGDRIEPQSLRIASDRLEVNFLGRDKAAPMTEPPSRPSVLLLKVTPDGVLEGLMR